MLIVIWELGNVNLHFLVVLLRELEWRLLQVVLGVTMIDECTKHSSLLWYHHVAALGLSLEEALENPLPNETIHKHDKYG